MVSLFAGMENLLSFLYPDLKSYQESSEDYDFLARHFIDGYTRFAESVLFNC